MATRRMATRKNSPEINAVPAVRLDTDPPGLEPFVDDAPDGRLCLGCVFRADFGCPQIPDAGGNCCNEPRPDCPDGIIYRRKRTYGNEED